MMTLFLLNLGHFPPPTRAMILLLYNISTIPIPPSRTLSYLSLKGNELYTLNPLSVPKFGIDWYAKAMNDPIIMNSPTAFGINQLGQVMAGGEKGSEVVSGTDTLMNMISSAVAAQNEKTYSILENIFAFLQMYIPEFAKRKMVLDTGVMVAQLAPALDEELGRIAVKNEREV